MLKDQKQIAQISALKEQFFCVSTLHASADRQQGCQTISSRKNQTAKKLNEKRTKPEKSAIFAQKLRFSAEFNEKNTTT